MFLLPAQTCGVSAYKAPSIWLKKTLIKPPKMDQKESKSMKKA